MKQKVANSYWKCEEQTCELLQLKMNDNDDQSRYQLLVKYYTLVQAIWFILFSTLRVFRIISFRIRL